MTGISDHVGAFGWSSLRKTSFANLFLTNKEMFLIKNLEEQEDFRSRF